jgi:DNA-binding transcriptional LysR family regulator
MKLNQLRDLLAVAEHGSLHAAARSLGVAQPALSRSIRELERELGATLFDRRAQGMIATPMGERLIRRAQAAWGELRRAGEEIDQLRGQTTGRIDVCLTTVPHLALLPDALRSFRTRYPDVLINIVEGRYPAIEAQLKSGLLDCYIGPLPAVPLGRDVVVETLFEQTYAVLCRKGHALAHARSMRELSDAEWLTHAVTAKPEEELGPLFEALGLPPPRLVVQSHTGLTFLAVAANSDLLTMAPTFVAEAPITRALLQRIDVAESIPCAPMVIIRRASMPLTPAGECFCDMMRRASVASHQGASQAKLAASVTGPAPL